MPEIDLDALKARALGSGSEDAVTVNTRVLIDKVLARYPGEWTVLRELLQNAADASATQVIIRFETLPSATVPVPQSADPSTSIKHVISHHTLKRMIVSNNGSPFNSNDWSRLKRIAEGNPDETKIGAFGVGFYSVFSDCEEPFVSSGDQAMAFYWKENSLFTRRLNLEKKDSSPDTTFLLNYRNTTSPVPHMLPLCQFLSTSLTFVGLEKIELWLDQWNILSLSRKAAPPVEMPLPRDIEPRTSGGLMKVVNLERGVAQIDGTWLDAVAWRPPKSSGRLDTSRSGETAPSLRGFFSRLAGGHLSIENEETPRNSRVNLSEPLHDLCKPQKTTVFLHIHTASIRTSTTQSFNQELERATKKPPPKTTKIAVLTSSFDESPLLGNEKPFADVFATVLPTKSGRIFIGFPTHQTTGLGAHISAPSLIPTVERESVDLNARWVKDWNLELLRAAGIVCRVAWTAQMTLMDESVRGTVKAAGRSKIRENDIAKCLSGFVRAAQNFTFRDSTPLANVGNVVEDFFWTCSKNASINVLSTCGVLPTHEVRITPKDLSFMSDIPVLPEMVAQEAKGFVGKLVDFGLVTEVTVSDIKAALERTPLTTKQLGEYLHWIGQKAVQGEIGEDTVQSLMTVAVASVDSDGGASQLIVLASIKNYLNASKIPSHMPVPPFVMPFSFTRQIGDKELKAIGWQELQIVPWLRWLTDESSNRALLNADQDLTTHPGFARSVLPIVSKSWEGLGTSSKDSVIQALSTRTTIPTTKGMKKPSESYFANVKVFEDLPLVSGLNGVKDKLLIALGVRKTVELGLVFDRLLAKSTEAKIESGWSHVDLIKYLASVRNDIPSDDIERLKTARICPKEAESGLEGSTRRYRFEDLYEPRPALRDLGLPLLQWPPNYKSISPEGRFMITLGLKSYPTVPQLVESIAKANATKDGQMRDKAMGYFLANHRINGYHSFDYTKVSTPFLPLQNSDALGTPSNCFTNESAAILGFNILQTSLHSHASDFGVQKNPPIQTCLDTFLRKLPTSRKEARAVFSYFSDRLSEISPAQYQKLSQEKFVPILTASHGAEAKGRIRYVSPNECYLGDSEDVYNGIFDFCDFGLDANAFLLKCGSKHEPTKVEIARMLVREPARILTQMGTQEKYLNLLRSLGDSIGTLRKDKTLFREMGKAPFLLASRFVATASRSTNSTQRSADEFEDADEEDSQGITEWLLTSASSAIVIDDYNSFSLFKASILAVPEEEGLEDLYSRLGSPRLSELLVESARHGQLLNDQSGAQKLQNQIYERSRLFLHDQPPEAIRHDTRWLEKNLVVRAVSSISLKRSLKGLNVTHVEKRKAVVTHPDSQYTLWIISGSIDFYQVSISLVNLLLSRPKAHSTIALETILRTDLRELGLRGFNVSRILRQKANEARLAEDRRQRQLEEERKQIEADEASWKTLQAHKGGPDTDTNNVPPGGFPDSPDRVPETRGTAAVPNNDEDAMRSTRGFMSNLTRRLGLDEGGRNSRHLQSLLGNAPAEQSSPNQQTQQAPPPPYSAEDPGKPKGPKPSTASPPHQIQQNLLSAIQKSRPYNSSDLYSRGETNNIAEASSYCDEKPAQDLTFAAEGGHGIRIFVPKTFPNATAFLSANSQGLSIFTNILRDVISIFSMRLDSVNVFFAPDSQSIAFNSKGAIFCNYHFFQQWHLPKWQQQPRDTGSARRDAMSFWWVTLCHELAHNLVEDHSANHSYYIESFVAGYFDRAAKAFGMVSNETPQPAKTPEQRSTSLLD